MDDNMIPRWYTLINSHCGSTLQIGLKCKNKLAMNPCKTIPKKKKCKKAKWLSEEALQIAVNRREANGKGEKERYTHLNAVSKNSKER